MIDDKPDMVGLKFKDHHLAAKHDMGYSIAIIFE